MTQQFLKHGFLGFGNMAKAIFRGLNKDISKEHFRYFSKTNRHLEIQSVNSVLELIKFSDIIWFGFKPQNLETVMDDLEKISFSGKCIVTMLAGKKIDSILKSIKSAAVVRIMPNLAIAYQKSVTSFCSVIPDKKSIKKVQEIKNCLEKLGVVLEIEELYFDLFTAIFGSGPAYLLEFFKVLESQSKKILHEGEVKKAIAMLLNGTLNYYHENEKQEITEMINKITSKGGTTEAGLKKFHGEKINDKLANVIEAAKKRSIEMGELNG